MADSHEGAAKTEGEEHRPDRVVGRVTTKEYVDHWAVGGNSFAEDPPNAVLSIHHEPTPLRGPPTLNPGSHRAEGVEQ